MPCFCVQTSSDDRVRSWFSLMHQKLQADDFFKYPFTGGVRYVQHGIYAVEIEPRYSRMVLNAMVVCLGAGAVVAAILGAHKVASVLGAVSVSALCILNIFWTPSLYQLLMAVQVRRLVGKWEPVQRADDKVLRMVIRGER